MAKQEYREAQRIKPMGYPGLKRCMDIVRDKQAGKINEVLVDLYSASAIVKVCEGLKPENKDKLVSLPVRAVVDIVFKVLAKAA